MKNQNLLQIAIFVVFIFVSLSSNARDYINVVGSSTVYPFSTVVAERFGKSSTYPTPKIESTGSGGGLKLFCSGLGLDYPDITNASRRIKPSELKSCFAQGVNDVIEVQIGFDGIVLANSNQSRPYSLNLQDIYLALAREVPNPDGSQTFVENPYQYWHDVNSDLPQVRIEVLGPPPTSGTRDAFAELALEGGCRQIDWIKTLPEARLKEVCRSVREDGAYIEAGENDNLIVQKLNANPTALGVFGFSFLDQNIDKVQGALIDGHKPEFENIAAKKYPVSRPLYFYVKKAHISVIPGIESFLGEFTAEKTWGEEGYLADKGMIPLDEQSRAFFARNVALKKNLTLDDLR